MEQIDSIKSSGCPSNQRIALVFDALTKMCQEKSVFQDYLNCIVHELHRAIFLKVGEFPVLYNFRKIDVPEVKPLEALEQKEITFFEALKQVLDIFDLYVFRARTNIRKLETSLEIMKKQDEAKDRIVKRLELDMEELRKNNTNPIFQQYISISEENARLNKELNLLKYKVTDLQEAHDNMKRIYEENKVVKKASTRSLKNIHSDKTELIARNKTLEEELEKIKIKLLLRLD